MSTESLPKLEISDPPAMPSLEPGETAPSRLLARDYLLLIAFCALLFGFEMFSGRPLSLHEARLPQCAREMMAGHEWLFPQSGGRPWLERPPLPHWVEIGVSLILGQHCDKVWVVRLPSVLAGIGIAVAAAWMASVWFGRTVGLLSGFVLATTYECYAYAVLAEDDTYLAALVVLSVTLFVSMEFASGRENDKRVGFFGNRPWQVWAFFLVLGLTNLVKGPMVGAAVVVASVGVFLLGLPNYRQLAAGGWKIELLRVRRYIWLWGCLMFGVLAVTWTIAARHRYPDISRNLSFDYEGTKQYDEPFWYYPVILLGLGMPWIIFAFVGLLKTLPAGLSERRSPARYLWCWAIMPVLVLSIPHRKHHHYLMPSFAPWTILAACGLVEVWKFFRRQERSVGHAMVEVSIFGLGGAGAILAFHSKLPGTFPATLLLASLWLGVVACFFFGLYKHSGFITAGACFVGIGGAYCWGQINVPDMTRPDTVFLGRVEASVPRDQLLFVNSDLRGEMDFFRNQFYLRPDARLLHNLTFLRDRDIIAPDVWVVSRYRDLGKLEQLGTVEVADESPKTRREDDMARNTHRPAHDFRFTLFRLHFRPDLPRYSRPAYVNTLQAMGRELGPFCGPALQDEPSTANPHKARPAGP